MKTLPDKLLKILPYLAIFAMAFLVYANMLDGEFIWDDEYLIVNNSQIKSFSHLLNTFRTYVGYGSENVNNFYRPMQEISNMLDYRVWGLDPSGFHLTNNVLHSIVSVLVMIFVLSLTKNILAAFISALLYAIHPVHSEAVAYIAGRADLLYTIFMLLSLIYYSRSVAVCKGRAPTLRSNENKYYLSLAFFVLALLSKEMAMVIPLIIFVYTLFIIKNDDGDGAYKIFKFRWIPYAVILGIYGVLRSTILNFNIAAPVSAFGKNPIGLSASYFFQDDTCLFQASSLSI